MAPKPGPDPVVLRELFGLTPVESRVASIISTGASPEDVAEKIGIAFETVRNHLKAVFAKTGTHRQSELANLLSQLSPLHSAKEAGRESDF